jgi:hypothetical protein
MANPEMDDLDLTSKIRNGGAVGSRWTARRSAPGPTMFASVVRVSWPLVSVMAPVTAKVIVSPGATVEIAARNDPGPLSAVVVTTAAGAWCSATVTRAAKRRGLFITMHVDGFLWCEEIVADP